MKPSQRAVGGSMIMLPHLPPRPRRGDPAETLARLTVAAARAFEEHGYFATDTNAIARAAGYAPGTFYKHFEDKTDAFVAAYAWWVREVWAGVDLAWTGQGGPGGDGPRDAARTAILHVLRVHAAWPGFRRDLRHLAVSEPRVMKAFTQNRKAQLARLVTVVGEARRAEAFVLLLTLERTADALAMGEVARMGLDAGAITAALVREAQALLVPSRP